MIHPDTELFDAGPSHGLGVRATAPIPAGTITWTLCALDRVMSPAAVSRLPRTYRPFVQHFAYRDHEGYYVLCWDAGRYVNHSCHANSRGLGQWSQVAVRDIAAGEELTCDYGECNLDEPMACACGWRGCRGEARAEDLLRLADDWDREVFRAVSRARGVKQPLEPYFRHGAGMTAILEGRVPPPSVRALAYARSGAVG